MYGRYATEAADARRDMDEAKNGLEVIKAETERAVRVDPEAHGIAKVTEKSVEAAVVVDEGVKAAQSEVVEVRHRYDVLCAAVSALDHRKKALEKLVELFLSDYFSRPRAAAGVKEKMDAVEQRAVRRKGRNREGR